MRSIKLLFFLLAFSLAASAQYVQPMGYKDYSFWEHMNIGNKGAKLTDASAYLELGKADGSTLGFLLPRGNKDAVFSPAQGLLFYDLPSNKVVVFNGSIWRDFGGDTATTGSTSFNLGYGLWYSNDAVATDTTKIATRAWASYRIDSTLAALSFEPYTNGYGLQLFGNQFKVDTSVIRTVAAGNAYTDNAIANFALSLPNYSDSLNSYVEFSDTVWLKSFITETQGAADSLHFTSGLTRLGNNVSPDYYLPMWNANRLQGYYIDAGRPGNGYFLGFDSSDGIARWMKPDSVVGGGVASTLQDVTDAGNITTNTIAADKYTMTAGGVNYTTLQKIWNASVTGMGGSLQLKSTDAAKFANLLYSGTIQDQFFLLPETGFGTDTLATLRDVRAAGGTGGGSTPGLFDVIDMNQVGGGYKNIDLGAGGINFNNGTIQLSDYGGGTIVGDGLTYLAGFDQYGQFIEVDPATLGGGGSTPTPGIDSVLAVDQTLSGFRDIGLNGYRFSMWESTGYWNNFQVEEANGYIAQSRSSDDYGIIRTFKSGGASAQNKAYMEVTGTVGTGGFQSAGIGVNAFTAGSSDPYISLQVTDYADLSSTLTLDEHFTFTGNIFGTRRSQFRINDAQIQIMDPYTPSGTSETTWATGTLLWDDNYIYIKTSAGFKRAALSTF